MKDKVNKVAKMLSPEETALLQDIGAGIQQLLQINTGETQEGGPAASPELQMAMDPDEDETAVAAAKSNDGPTANEKAETRVEDPTDITDDSLALVGKALKVLLEEAGTPMPEPQMAQKSIDMQAIVSGISKQLVPVINKVNTVEKALESVLDALGFADAIVEGEPAPEASTAVVKSQTTGMKPVASKDAGEFISMLSVSIAKALKDDRKEAAHEIMHDPSGIAKAREDLRSNMGILLNKNKT